MRLRVKQAVAVLSTLLIAVSCAGGDDSRTDQEVRAVRTDDNPHRDNDPLQIIIMGPPGAGKGTQAMRISEKYRIAHISTGAILRAEVDKESDLGNEVKAVMERGELVADGIILGLVRARIDGPDCARGFILDGFPRTLSQAEGLDELLRLRGTPEVTVIDLVVAEEELTRRLLTRKRADDTESTIRNRIRVYHDETLPLLEYYKEKDTPEKRTLFRVNGDQPIEKVFAEIEGVLSRM